MIQKVKAPIKLFYQMSNLRFFPVVDASAYKDWKDLNGQEMAVHSRGSGTEAIMKMMASATASNTARSATCRARGARRAMLQGNIKATVVDAANRRLLEERRPASSPCCRWRTSTRPTRRSSPTPSSWNEIGP